MGKSGITSHKTRKNGRNPYHLAEIPMIGRPKTTPKGWKTDQGVKLSTRVYVSGRFLGERKVHYIKYIKAGGGVSEK